MKSLFKIIILLTVVCFSSCRTQYVPVEAIKTEYSYIDRLKHDSIYQHDSINIYHKGDTIYRDRYKYLYKYLFTNKVDSFIKTDSIQVPYPVERQLTKWQSLKIEIGGWAFGALILIVIAIVIKFVRERIKK